jgi:outer membrane lipoprotein SlyB
MNINGAIKNTGAIVTIIALTGCAATHTAVNKRTLNVQTKMSETIFLTPTSPEKKTIFVQIKNTSDKQNLELNPKVTEAMFSKGYTVVADPDKANFLLQANILQVGNVDLREANEALNQGYGSAINGAVVGGLVGSMSGSGGFDSIATGGLIGAGVATIGNALIKDVTFSIITDVQISEKANGVAVTQNTNSTLKQGTSGNVIVKSTETTNWKKYQTRILSTANKANLKFNEAEPELIAGLLRSISGLM